MANKGDIKDETATAASVKYFTRAEVAKHVNSSDVWIIIHNDVYNVTSFCNEVAIFTLNITKINLQFGPLFSTSISYRYFVKFLHIF